MLFLAAGVWIQFRTVTTKRDSLEEHCNLLYPVVSFQFPLVYGLVVFPRMLCLLAHSRTHLQNYINMVAC